MRTTRRHRVVRGQPDDAGVTATSVAVVFTAVLVLTMLVVQAGLYYHAQHRAAAAADEAVAAARFGGDGVAAAESFLAGAPLEDSSISGPGDDPDVVQYTVTGTVEHVVPLMGGVEFTVSATASAPREQFVPEPDRG